MNREIKFRAYHKEQGCMYFTQSSIGSDGDGWIESIDFDGKLLVLGCQSDDGDYTDTFNFEDVELMQYTGLKDKNGKEIYEGDIVEWSIFTDAQDLAEGENEEKRIRDTVAYSNGCWKVEKRCELLGLKEPYRKLEVIGNIYEPPELLTDIKK